MVYKSTEFVSNEYLSVNNCGVNRLFDRDAGSTRPNGRLDYHILYIAEGRCFVTLDGEVEETPAGSIVVFLPRQPQEYRFYKRDKSVSYYLHFSGTACADVLKEMAITDRNIYYIGKSPTLEKLLNNLIDEYRQQLKFSKYRMAGLLLDILSLIGRKNSNMKYGNPDINQKFAEVCSYMAQNFANDMTVEDYARMCNLSESRFSHRFSEIIGTSPKQYIINLRIEAAKELLINSDQSVLQIGEAVGFSTQNYFSRIFKKQTGLSPTEYRNIY